jgi:lysophospholipase L1-like esterase
MKKLVLFGDSLFGQVSKSEQLLLEKKLGGEYDVYNCATGGWNTDDLIIKAPYIAQLKPDLVILSIGTNDAAPWKKVELSKFKENLPKVLDQFSRSRIVFFLPPPVNESLLQDHKKTLTNEIMKQYFDAAKAICQERKVEYFDSWSVLLPIVKGDDTFHSEDGVHISDEGYDLLFTEFNKVISK